MAKVALITGITGQDGSYLAEFLLEKGYEVHGITRRASISNTARIDHLMGKITLHDGDLSDSSSLIRIISLVNPDEIYNLAAQSHVQVSFDVPEYSGDVDALGVLRILEACRILGLTKKTKVYQASTSELYGKVEEVPQKETTPFHPYSPYAVAKQYGFWIVKEYREAYGMFAVNGILFNHESERRGENFVTRKITLAAGRIAEGLQDHLELGNMDSLRDWGYAKDYVECMWMIMQHETPEDFVIANTMNYNVLFFESENNKTLESQRTNIKIIKNIYDYIKDNENINVLKMNICDNNKIIFNRIISKLKNIKEVNVLDVEHMTKKLIKTGTEEAEIEYYYTEITSQVVNKWNAIEKLIEILNMDKEQVITIGDNANDTMMIENAGMGVIMGNAAPYLKENAKFVTKSNNEDGVAEALEKLILTE